MQQFKNYVYLEIGSYLGGSLHFHLTNSQCVTAYSVDTRQTGQIRDERNIVYQYTTTTQDMLDMLTEHKIPTDKLITVDGNISDVPTTHIDLIFVDGEHTNSAVYSDAKECMRFTPRVILFHDDWIVSTGLAAAAQELTDYTLLKLANCDISALVANTALDQFKFTTVSWSEFSTQAKNRMKQYENTKTNLR